MEPLIEQLSRQLRSEYPGSQVLLDVWPSAKVGGFVIWDGFDQLESLDRQKQIAAFLREKLGPDHGRTVAAILAFTHFEWKRIEEQRKAEERDVLAAARCIRKARGRTAIPPKATPVTRG